MAATAQKTEVVAQLTEAFKAASGIYLADFTGLTVEKVLIAPAEDIAAIRLNSFGEDSRSFGVRVPVPSVPSYCGNVV